MKAFVLDRYGKKRALRSAEMPNPEPRDDEVLVHVHAAGVNLLDDRAAAELGIRRKARSRGVDFSFLFMKANGDQLHEITRLFDAGVIRPVIDRVFAFKSTNEAMAYVEAGRAKGKVVVKLR